MTLTLCLSFTKRMVVHRIQTRGSEDLNGDCKQVSIIICECPSPSLPPHGEVLDT